MRKASHASCTVDAEAPPSPSVFCSLPKRAGSGLDPPTKQGPPEPLCPLSEANEPFRGLRRPTGRQRPKDRKDDQGRNDRVVQIGPDGLAASAHVMGCPQNRGPHWGYRRRYLSNAVGYPDRGRETARFLGIQ